MNRFLLAAALVVVCAAPVSAASGKMQTKTKHIPVGPTSERLSKALGGFNRGDPKDPYWEPCLCYYRSWGPGACGR
jgi:hypothetical protein